jgi:hypothetical protein
MKKLLSIFSCLLIFSLGIGCVHRHEVAVNPKVFVKPSSIGNGRTIYLKVIDSRPNNDIYKREGNFKTNKVRIVADSSLEDSITKSLQRGFQDLGFRVKTRPVSGASSLKIAIVETKFSMFTNTSGFHQKMRAGFRTAVKAGSQKYAQTYRDVQKVSQKVPFGRFLNERLINLAISQSLQKIFSDPKLLNILANPS